jgi:hypothetical protein
VGLNPEPNACRKRGTKLFTVVINQSLLSSPCSAVPTHRSRCGRGLLGFRLRTVGSPGQRGGATDGGHGSRIAAAFTLRLSRRRQDPAVSRVGLGAAAYTLCFFPGFHRACTRGSGSAGRRTRPAGKTQLRDGVDGQQPENAREQ